MKSFLSHIALASLLLIVPLKVCAQNDSAYSFIAAGHAYGAHSGGNTGLHPALLNSLHSGYDSTAKFIVFTGDIVNVSTSENWQQVDVELSAFPFDAYYVMGNHGDNTAGYQEFNNKFGGSYYSFYHQNEVFIVLNSVISGRSVSADQIIFLKEELSQLKDSQSNVFIFFHEILWNSHGKYSAVRSNSRSRYDQMKDYSNYWMDIHPLLKACQDKNFYLITGDVGGNPDAIAAFYDRWDNVTFISSGMGEVADENYLLVRIHKQDSVSFELVPLNPEISMQKLEYYSIPHAPGPIAGPIAVTKGATAVEYTVPEVFNADTYFWKLPPGVSGSSVSSSISLDFDNDYSVGVLSVIAEKDGFGKGPASSIYIETASTGIMSFSEKNSGLKMEIVNSEGLFQIRLNGIKENEIKIQMTDISGRVFWSGILKSTDGKAEQTFNINYASKGIMLISAYNQSQYLHMKYHAWH